MATFDALIRDLTNNPQVFTNKNGVKQVYVGKAVLVDMGEDVLVSPPNGKGIMVPLHGSVEEVKRRINHLL
ncbi:hypothetical protein [Thalassobacillus pellis]|uniref:hypothetical protein n=1 Tax=Thalassobacillus pellis TaxID=748008 RepID=UPI0019618798|nr:hypothetical protein [Thalassobacillus pellis]MBM7554548.1 hypothetical protein [Thalassobacillus pellis]